MKTSRPFGVGSSCFCVWSFGELRPPHRLAAMSTLGLILIIVGAVILVLLIGGFVASRRYRATHEDEIAGRIAAADQALEHARAADKGWDRAALEAAARDAIQGSRPGWEFEELVLVLVDDRPGVEQDRAHFMASGADDQARVVLARTGEGWAFERIE